MDEMEEIISEFITEAEESLDRIDPLFVELESKGYDRDILNDIFRSVHTLKGAAGFLGFQSIVDIAHRAESILKRLRDGEIAIKKSYIDVILESVDMLRLLIGHIKDRDGKEEDISNLINRLELALNQEATAEAEKMIPQETISVIKTEENNINPPSEASSPVISDKVTEKKESLQTLRIDVDRVDKVMNLTG